MTVRLAVLGVIAVSSTAHAGKTMLAMHVYTGETRACTPLDGGGFLVGTGGGLVHLDAAGKDMNPDVVDPHPLTGMRIDSISTVTSGWWIGTDRGVRKLEPTKWGPSLAADEITIKGSVRDAIEHAGATYFATETGVMKLAANGRLTTLAFTGAGNANRARVSSLAIANGTLWAGTANGLFQLTSGKLAFAPLEAGANEIASLYGDGTTLWIATTNGLYSREGATVRGYGGGDLRRVTSVDGAITAAGVGGGVVTVDRGRLVDAKVPKKLVMTQAITERGGVACAGGLASLWIRPANGAWREIMRPVGLPSNDISALAGDGRALWVGMFDHGVARLDGGYWTHFKSDKIDRRVNALLVEPRLGKRSRIWVATATGLSIIDFATTNPPVITQLTKADGLPARGVLSLARMRDGRILAGTMRGAAIIGEGRPITIGLKQNLDVQNVWAVAEDKDGYLWLGATTGVYRGKADDSSWTRYSVATGHLRDDWVMALVTRENEDLEKNEVFVGTYKGGLTKLVVSTDDDKAKAIQLGDGWINPGGLRFDHFGVEAATMEGLRHSDMKTAWSTRERGPDTTATARAGGHWIATRRGLTGWAY